MAVAPIPENEGARRAAHHPAVPGPSADDILNRLGRLAASMLGAPIALISLVDQSRHGVVAAAGLDEHTVPIEVSFCAQALVADDVLVVPDATTDPRFAADPLVVGDSAVRSCVAVPLVGPDDVRLGTLCVLDRTARAEGPTATQRHHLRDLGALVVDRLERRRSAAESVQRDTTERHAQMAALQESEQRYRLLFHANPQPMWVYDSETLAFLDVNAAAEAMYGYSRDEFLARTLPDIRPAEEIEHVRQVVARVPQGIAHSGPWRHLRKDGRPLFVRISSYPATFEGRRVRLVLAHDITTEKALEEQLVQAQKMEAVGQLAGGVAHDFNNLLTVINGYARLLAARLPAGDPLRADADHILQAGERAASLTQQLLAFSRRQVLQPRPVDVGDVIGHLRSMLGRLLREDIEVRTTLPPSLPPVMVDPGQLEQVLLNLAINGSDAMPDGGTLSLDAVEVVADAEMAERQSIPEGRYVALSMSDSGVGMTEETRGRIFEPFFTTKAKGRGSGLGLPVAYGIVRQSGGTIVVHTTRGHGSTFTVYLPLADAPVVEEDATAPVDLAGPGSHETVLIVEDHEAVRRFAADVLRAQGYEVLVAEHGPEAIALVEARGGRIDLLVTDVIMPRMGGREVATALQQRVPGIGVLFMSGYTQTAIERNGALESGLHFLAKPFMPAELLARVRAVLAARAR